MTVVDRLKTIKCFDMYNIWIVDWKKKWTALNGFFEKIFQDNRLISGNHWSEFKKKCIVIPTGSLNGNFNTIDTDMNIGDMRKIN